MTLRKKTLEDTGTLGGRNVFYLGVVSFFNDFASEMIYPLLPVFLTVVLGVGGTVLGAIEGVAESTSAILKYFSGRMSDTLGKRKPIFVFGYTLSNIVRPLMGIAGTWWHVMLLRFSDRVGKGVRTAPRDALLADSVSSERRGTAFGFQRALDHAGAVAGPLAAVLILPHIGNDLRTLFLLSAIPGVVVLLIVGFLVREVPVEKKAEDLPPVRGFSSLDETVKRYLAAVLLFSLGNASDAFLLLKATDAGIKMIHIPVIWIVLHVVKSTTSIPGGMLADRKGKKQTILAGWLVYAVIYALFAATESAVGVWVLFGVYGIYYGLTEGTERAFMAELVSEESRGTAFGFFHLTVGLAAFPASLIFGFMWDFLGSRSAFLLGAMFALAASILMFSVKGQNPQGQNPQGPTVTSTRLLKSR
ncbi:MAG: MFS transporter [Deltaproteobacteria bacterium]|nr:MFS transporter [Candidatus Zymogenaceae bacterium]